jgi:predicted MFS family arabinose efflux permease
MSRASARTPGNDMAPYKGHWFITGLGVGQIVTWGTFFYSFPLIAEPMARELSLSKPAVYGAASIGLAVAGLVSYPVGAAIDRGRGRVVMAAGTALGGLLFIAWSQVASLWAFYPILAGIGLVQAMTLYEPAFAVVARRFRDDARGGITALTLWGGFASTVFVPVTQLLVDQFGWREALVILGLFNLLFCAGLYIVTINPRNDPPPLHPPGADAAEALSGRKAIRWALGQPIFWGLMISFAVFLGAHAALIFHLYPLLLERGYDTATTVAALAIIGPAQVAGRIVIWLFASNATIRAVGMVTVLLFPAGLALLFMDQLGFLAPALFAVIYGAGNGIFTIVRGTAVPEMLTREAYGAINGVLAAPATVLRALGPVTAALLWAWGGSYTAVLAAVIAASALVALAFWFAALAGKPSGGKLRNG